MYWQLSPLLADPHYPNDLKGQATTAETNFFIRITYNEKVGIAITKTGLHHSYVI